jgi:uncharacterized SAM-binding protein YcdF (DUF218 family)
VTASCDAIVVLGARIQPDGLPGPAVRRRVERAALAFEQGIAPIVVPSGGRRWHGHLEAGSMRSMLVKLGVPEDRIVIEGASMTTAENALFTTRLASQRRWSHLAVVTCAWHIPRAVLDFRRCGLDVMPIAASGGTSTLRERAVRSVKEWTCTRLDGVRLRMRVPR